MANGLPTWLLPAALAAGVVGLVALTRKPSAAGAAHGGTVPIGGGPRGDMKDAIRVGDIVHVMPSEVIPNLTPLPLYLVVARVVSVTEATVRGEVTQIGPNLRGLEPSPSSGPYDFSKDEVITIIRNGVEIA